ncbi:hypothetical protein [Flavobacterium covae]|uniref:hypothetical protein n=1 Tax=Flavobacterium covae TaxID=2906076 RepID=UPI000745B4ED|nr:hypothetical protein [Flavobacterium covae]AMA48089.1 hypothetical protein AWN65_00740 [Flavobacterium covae]MCJ1808887.1 hypothetical protein [Flavobacterium covae]
MIKIITDKEKILQYLNIKGISKNKFYVTTGLSVGFLDSGSSLGVDKLRLIIDNYPDLNVEWFVLDKGEMLKETFNLKPTTYLHDNIEEETNNNDYLIEVQKKLIEKLEKEVKELKEQLDQALKEKA